MSNCLGSLLKDDIERSAATTEDMVDFYVSVKNALELLVEFDEAEDENLKHEFGYQYAQTVSDIDEMLLEMNKDSGINLFLH